MDVGRIYTIIDIETNGKFASSADILEVGYMQIDKDLNILRGESLHFYKDEFIIENEAQEIHGLTREFLRPYKDQFPENVAKLFTLFFRGDIIGKNSNRFDIPCIIANLSRYATSFANTPELQSYWDVEDAFAPYFKQAWMKRYNESTRRRGTLEEYMNILGYPKEALQKHFLRLFPNEKRATAHSALFDVFMTYLVVKDLVNNHGVNLNIPRRIVSQQEYDEHKARQAGEDTDYGYEI